MPRKPVPTLHVTEGTISQRRSAGGVISYAKKQTNVWDTIEEGGQEHKYWVRLAAVFETKNRCIARVLTVVHMWFTRP